MRAFRILGLLVILSLALSACAAAPAPAAQAPAAQAPAAEQPAAAEAAAPATSGELKVAVLAPLSGPVPTFGVMTRDGALLAIEEWNAKGGVLGMKIVPIVEDSQCTPDPAVNAANKVIDQDKVHYIIGEVCSKASIPVSEIANAKKVVEISPTSTNPVYTLDKDGKAKQYVFRACFNDNFQGKIAANFALNNLKAKTAFVLLDQANDYVKGLAEVFTADFTAGGGTIVGTESYTAQDTDFSAILAKVADANPEVVYLPDYYNIVNLVTKQAKEKGITAPFLGADGWDSSDLDLKAAAGGYFTNHYSPEDPRPEVQNFVKTFRETYNNATPDALATLAYDATNLLLEGIKAAGVDDSTAVATALTEITFNGVSGQIHFDANHDPVKPLTILKVTDDGVKFDSVVNP
ncbi:MAG: Leucine-, isoleucine-, valine-, threonine-, and alanine-binding protein precursor [Chloroflexi bacterium ADurb.Bin325]|nr:MAG: Leucine-, isoleucine-, valine-, threonine-, and alanine-binding protein precursor [Chloroflexi bacterium ADurb.Bin325]